MILTTRQGPSGTSDSASGGQRLRTHSRLRAFFARQKFSSSAALLDAGYRASGAVQRGGKTHVAMFISVPTMGVGWARGYGSFGQRFPTARIHGLFKSRSIRPIYSNLPPDARHIPTLLTLPRFARAQLTRVTRPHALTSMLSRGRRRQKKTDPVVLTVIDNELNVQEPPFFFFFLRIFGGELKLPKQSDLASYAYTPPIDPIIAGGGQRATCAGPRRPPTRGQDSTNCCCAACPAAIPGCQRMDLDNARS